MYLEIDVFEVSVEKTLVKFEVELSYCFVDFVILELDKFFLFDELVLKVEEIV